MIFIDQLLCNTEEITIAKQGTKITKGININRLDQEITELNNKLRSYSMSPIMENIIRNIFADKDKLKDILGKRYVSIDINILIGIDNVDELINMIKNKIGDNEDKNLLLLQKENKEKQREEIILETKNNFGWSNFGKKRFHRNIWLITNSFRHKLIFTDISDEPNKVLDSILQSIITNDKEMYNDIINNLGEYENISLLQNIILRLCNQVKNIIDVDKISNWKINELIGMSEIQYDGIFRIINGGNYEKYMKYIKKQIGFTAKK